MNCLSNKMNYLSNKMNCLSNRMNYLLSTIHDPTNHLITIITPNSIPT